MSVRINHLTKKFGNQVAVNDISFEIGNGITGFLGPNGAGKSTTMKIISGYLDADSGEVMINGIRMHPGNSKTKETIGYLPESNPLYVDMYVKEYLGFIAALHRMKHIAKSVSRVIELTGLQSHSGKKIGALSKGYKQRVGLAAALVHDPGVLILDEPTSGLDPNQIVEIRNVIRMLGQTRTILFSTHIMQEVESLCRRVIIINNGKIIADDNLENLRSQSTAETLLSVEFAEKLEAADLQALSHVIKVSAAGAVWKITTESPDELRKVLLQFALEKQLTLVTLQSEGRDLESVFQSLTLSKHKKL